MKRYEQGSVGMRPDPEGSWCDYTEAQAEIKRLRKQIAVWLECYQTEKAKREELIKRVREALGNE